MYIALVSTLSPWEYTVVYIVVQKCLLSISALSDKHMHTTMCTVTATGPPMLDKCGKHTPGTKKSEHVPELIHEHASSMYPQSVLSLHEDQVTLEEVLSSALNKVKLYELYREWRTENYPDKGKVKESYYSNNVNTSFNIGFALVKTDMYTIFDL